MKNPLVSVVMPAYNAEKYLENAVNSILNQTTKDFELIIVNDGSKDNSKKIIKEFKKKEKRIKLINNEKNLGLQKSLNKGLKIAKGKYIARMDADDISLPQRFEIQVNYLDKNKDIFLIGTSAIVIGDDNKKIGILKKFNNPIKIKEKLMKTNPIIHSSIMFRNTKEFFYREKFKTSEDYDLYLRVISSGKKITNLPDFLIKYRVSKGSFVSTMPNQRYYFEKSKQFFNQRIKSGKDDYENLKPPKEKNIPKNLEKSSLKARIFMQLMDGQSRKVRKNIGLYNKRYGSEKTTRSYYILSFFPKHLIWFIQKIFN